MNCKVTIRHQCWHETTRLSQDISVDIRLQGYYKPSVLTWDYKVIINHQGWHEITRLYSVLVALHAQGYHKTSVLTWDMSLQGYHKTSVFTWDYWFKVIFYPHYLHDTIWLIQAENSNIYLHSNRRPTD